MKKEENKNIDNKRYWKRNDKKNNMIYEANTMSYDSHNTNKN